MILLLHGEGNIGSQIGVHGELGAQNLNYLWNV